MQPQQNQESLVLDVKSFFFVIAWATGGLTILIEAAALFFNHQLLPPGANYWLTLLMGGALVSILNFWTWRRIEEMYLFNDLYRKKGKTVLFVIADIIGSGVIIIYAFRQIWFALPFPLGWNTILFLLWTSPLVVWSFFMIPLVKLTYPENYDPEQIVAEKRERFWRIATWVFGFGGMLISVGVIVLLITIAILEILHSQFPANWLSFLKDPPFYLLYAIQSTLFFFDSGVFWVFAEHRYNWLKKWPLDPPETAEEKGPEAECWLLLITGLVNFGTFFFFVQLVHGMIGIGTAIAAVTLIVNTGLLIKNWNTHLEIPKS